MNTYLKICLFVALILQMIGCQSKTQTKRIYFFEQENKAIIIPVAFNDTIAGRFLFDTGVANGLLVLDSAFCANNPLRLWNKEPDQVYFTQHTGWDAPHAPRYRQALYSGPIAIAIDTNHLTYDCAQVRNQKYSSVEHLQGTIGFPRNDSTHVWELNFEHNYLEIHQATHFQKPDKCYWFPFVAQKGDWYSIHIQFPITIKDVHGNTITINYPYLLDTGAAMDFVLLQSAKEIDFFRKRDDAILLNANGGYRSRYDVGATVFGDFQIDSMRIYTDEIAEDLSSREKGIIGLNFLKRFNVFFDFVTQQVGLQPIKNFTRIIDKEARRFYFSINTTADGRQFVSMIPDNVKTNYYKDAGLQVGDELISINGFSVRSMTPEAAAKIKANPTKKITLVRNGKPIEINVYIDPKEVNVD